MVWFILGCVVALVGVGSVLYSLAANENSKVPTRLAGIGALVLGIGLMTPAMVFPQNPGEAKVIKNFGGSISGVSTDSGFHMKAPWQDTTTFDTKNNQLEYRGQSEITFNDKDNATGNLDITVRYSLEPTKVADIYTNYQTQENFMTRQLDPDVRSVSRTAPAKYSTAEVFGEKRNQIGADIQKTLAERWEKAGVRNVEVNIQGVRYSDNIVEANNNLAAERTKAQQAKAETVTAEEQAKKKVVEAQAQAKANELLTKSLTPEVLQAKQIEALQIAAEKGQLIITDGKTTPLVDVTKK